MRILVIKIFCLITNSVAIAQGLSIELSISWKTDDNCCFNVAPMKRDTSMVLPYLKLAYRNLTDQKIYFKGIIDDDVEYPPVGSFMLLNTSMDMAERAKINFDYSDVKFRVNILNDATPLSGFDILTIDSSKRDQIDLISNDLVELYTVLEIQQQLNKFGIDKQLSCFDYPDKKAVSYREAERLIFSEKDKRGLIKPALLHFPNHPLAEEEILKEYSEQFVFLNPEETYEQEVNLIGFYLLGGSYEFTIANHSLSGYVLGKDRQKMQLPKVVNGYQLNEGAFLTNTVGIGFD